MTHTQTLKNSSQLSEASYDPEIKTLRITFSRGVQYDYFDVPISIYTQLIGSPKPSDVFNKEIKDVFKYKRVI